MVVIYHAVHLIDLLKNLYYHHVTSAKLYEAIKYFARRQIIVSYKIKLNWTNLFQYKNLYYILNKQNHTFIKTVSTYLRIAPHSSRHLFILKQLLKRPLLVFSFVLRFRKISLTLKFIII